MYNVSYFNGDQTNVNPDGQLSYEQLKNTFSKARKGKKHEAYFTRGLCDGSRCDEDIKKSGILIIDGDEGKRGRNAPNPSDVHEALKELGLNHIIYTSHSHSEDVNKFRVLLPCDNEYEKKDLKANNSLILKKLADLGIWIKHVKEMDAWSQAWFIPTRDDPSDGLFEFYEYHDGVEWSVIYEQESKTEDKAQKEEGSAERSSGEDSDNGETLDELYENIRTGREFHESMRTISYQLAKDGMSAAHIKSMMRMLMDSSKESGSDRWNTRYNEIDNLVDGAFKLEEVKLDFVIEDEDDKVKVTSPPPMPSGLLGKFIKETKEFMLYEDETIAFVASMFMICSITGRKFNVDIHNKQGMAKPTALNMYFTLAAETGVGKSEIEDAVENAYVQFSGDTGKVQDFFYKGRVTGPRALYRVYKDQRCIGIIANEAGIEGKSKLGDSQGLMGAWLNLYGQGSWKKWTGASELSDVDNSIQSLRAVAISRVSESTPVELASYYRQGASVENGLIPRENMFVIKDIQTEPNENIRLKYSDDIIEKMNHLVSVCSNDVGEDGLFKPYIISVDDHSLLRDMVNTQQKYRTIQRDGASIHERAMSGRMFVKMLRYVGLITVFNKSEDSDRALLIDWADWEWAKRVVEDEYDKISDVVALTSGDDVMDKAVEVMCTKIGCIISGTIKNKELRVTPQMKKRGVVPVSYIKKACRTNPIFDELKGNPKYGDYKSGIDKTLNYIQRLDYITEFKKNPLARGQCVSITDGLIEYLEGLNIK